LRAALTSTQFIDIGVPERLERAGSFLRQLVKGQGSKVKE
jgi:hypothetical protein